MPSLRLRLLDQLQQRLEPAVAPVRVVRLPTLPQVQAPALLLVPESDEVRELANDRADRRLVIRLTGYARATQTLAAEQQLDALMLAAHEALFADVTLGGLALGVRETSTDWDAEETDGSVLALTTHFEIRYRTFVSNPALPG